MKIKQMIGDKVLVQEINKTLESPGGIILPMEDDESKQVSDGIVISIGIDVEHVVPGDRVLFESTIREDITLDWIDYVVTFESEILSILEEE